jgi:putative membrane protein
MSVETLAGLPAFAAYVVAAAGLCALYLVAYTKITPHNEFDLIIREQNASAALALGMSLLGFSIPLASAIFHAASLLECAIWGVVALGAQLAAYALARLAHPGLSDAIAANTISAAIWLGFVSLTAGVLSAASMSY